MRHRRTVLAVTAGAGALAVALTAGLLSSGGVADDGPHKLTTPKTVLHKYHFLTSNPNGRSATQQEHKVLGVHHGHAVSGHYTTLDLTDVDVADLDFSHPPKDFGDEFFLDGTWGSVADPERAVDAFFSTDESADVPLIEWVGEPEEQSPEGFEGAVMKCQVSRRHQLTSDTYTDTPSCVWADHSTVAWVWATTPDHPFSMSRLARLTADLRKAIRVPLDLER